MYAGDEFYGDDITSGLSAIARRLPRFSTCPLGQCEDTDTCAEVGTCCARKNWNTPTRCLACAHAYDAGACGDGRCPACSTPTGADPYKEGREAQVEGISRHANPYEASIRTSRAAHHWAQGWDDEWTAANA